MYDVATAEYQISFPVLSAAPKQKIDFIFEFSLFNFVSAMKDVLGQAMYDYYFKKNPQTLWIHNNYGDDQDMPVKTYFRAEDAMPKLEQLALKLCRGKVLDIGAGVGSHTLALQSKDFDVTAIDISPKASEIMKHRGVKNVETGDVFSYHKDTFDTLLFMMNGIGFTGSVLRFRSFLQYAKTLINPGGQLLSDSCDVAYLYDGKLPQREEYYGEITYQYDYKGQKTDWFTWLYIDRYLLARVAAEEGWKATVMGEDKWDKFLVRLTLK